MHPKVLSCEAWDLVRQLQKRKMLEGWALAGGTGLALHFGHRYSENLDFFRPEEFDPESLLTGLSKMCKVAVQDRSESTLHALVEGIRLSFLKAHPPLLFEGTSYRNLNLANPRDIALMKIIAVGGRGSRKDFIDLYFYTKLIGGLDGVLALLPRRFADIDYNDYHLLKSLVYFADAETEPMPRMIKKITWSEVKKEIIRQVRSL